MVTESIATSEHTGLKMKPLYGIPNEEYYIYVVRNLRIHFLVKYDKITETDVYRADVRIP